MAKKTINTLFFLQMALALVLISYGLLAFSRYNSSGAELLRGMNKLFGKSGPVFPLLFGIIQLAAGLFLLAEPFLPFPAGPFKAVHLLICLFWIISIALDFFLSGLLKPDLLRWLAGLSPQLVILLSLWVVGQEQ